MWKANLLSFIGFSLFIALGSAQVQTDANERLYMQNDALQGFELDSSYNLNDDIVFVDTIPDFSLLSSDEQKCLGYKVNSDNDIVEVPWFIFILQQLGTYLCITDDIPDEFGEEAIKVVLEQHRLIDTLKEQDIHAYYERHRCPITRSFPKLNEMNFSKGNILIIELTTEEKIRFHAMKGLSCDINDAINSTALYYRFYGVNTTIAQGIWWIGNINSADHSVHSEI